MRILLVEDDESIAQVLRENLESQHYLVDLATDGQAGWELAEAFEYGLILLDLVLPKLDGISFCRQLRTQGNRTPILLLTAIDSSTNKVTGLDAGADDYVVKPFNLHELSARIRALLRRGSSTLSPVLEWGNLCLDPSNCSVTYSGQLLHLTSKEYALLELFLRNTHRIFSQNALLDHLWSFEEPPSENTVRSHIKILRQKLKKAGAPDLIETIYGLGYRLKSTSHSATTTAQPQQQVSPELTATWEKFKDKYSARIKVLEQAMAALLEGTPTEGLRQQALREAHTLIGSLGSFGFEEACRLCREIERMLQAEANLSRAHLSELVMALRQELRQPSVLVKPQALRPTQGHPAVLPYQQQPRLLIVDDDAVLVERLLEEAKAWGMQVGVACDLSKAREEIAHSRPDVVLLDLSFPNSAENGFRLLAELATYQPPIAVVVFTAQENFAERVKVARLGGQGFLQKPTSPAQVIDAIAQVLQQPNTPEAKLLVVDNDPDFLDFLRTLLKPWGFKLSLLDDSRQFWNILEQFEPDLLILDVEMPELSGIDLCQVVRNDPRWSELPVLFLSARTDVETVHQVFTAGADDYVNKPIVGPELVARILNRLERTQTQRKQRKLQSASG